MYTRVCVCVCMLHFISILLAKPSDTYKLRRNSVTAGPQCHLAQGFTQTPPRGVNTPPNFFANTPPTIDPLGRGVNNPHRGGGCKCNMKS